MTAPMKTMKPGERLAVLLHEGEPEPGELGSKRVPLDPIEVVVPIEGDIVGTFNRIPITMYDPWVSLWRGEEQLARLRIYMAPGVIGRYASARDDLTIYLPTTFGGVRWKAS